NAQRRLKLYERFQDMPLHPEDRRTLEALKTKSHRDPFSRATRNKEKVLRLELLRHSPRPDWLIFRDVARAVGWVAEGLPAEPKPNDRSAFLQEIHDADFNWFDSSRLADEMARLSHRGLAKVNCLGQSLLGDLHWYGKARKVKSDEGLLHTVLGKGGADARAELLQGFFNGEADKPYYFIHDESEIHGNGVASNGVMLPVVGVDSDGNDIVEPDPDQRDKIVRIRGTLRQAPKGPFFFVKAPWEGIEPFFHGVNQESGHGDEVFLTNGRFNHLWNNMFHHLRNDYVSHRYPEKTPGTVLEINDHWARERGIENGQVLRVGNGSAGFLAVASLQEGVADGAAFAMFS
ncbi:MAG: hypothetical protein N2C14_33150, partial [Planctomycetales bacterium]